MFCVRIAIVRIKRSSPIRPSRFLTVRSSDRSAGRSSAFRTAARSSAGRNDAVSTAPGILTTFSLEMR